MSLPVAFTIRQLPLYFLKRSKSVFGNGRPPSRYNISGFQTASDLKSPGNPGNNIVFFLVELSSVSGSGCVMISDKVVFCPPSMPRICTFTLISSVLFPSSFFSSCFCGFGIFSGIDFRFASENFSLSDRTSLPGLGIARRDLLCLLIREIN